MLMFSCFACFIVGCLIYEVQLQKDRIEQLEKELIQSGKQLHLLELYKMKLELQLFAELEKNRISEGESIFYVEKNIGTVEKQRVD